MASISNTQQVANPGFNPWSSTASLDTSTGNITISVNGGSGRLLYQGDPSTVTNQITQNSEYNNDKAFFDSLISTIDGQAASLQAQYEALVPAAGSGETTDSTNTEQQNKQYIASGGIDDDSGSIQRFDDGSSIQTFDDGSTLAIGTDGALSSSPSFEPPVSNAGSTVAGKSGTPVAKNTKPKPGKRLQNPLGDFSSYTYQISLYMITPDAYDAFLATGRKDINALRDSSGTGAGAYLVVQSGGINNATSKRAPGFNYDYYIDDLKITQAISGKDTLAATNVSEFSFNIYEPYGFSFVTNLRTAMETLAKTSKSKNYDKVENPSRQFFILAFRFLGYDKNGEVIGSSNSSGTNTDPTGNANGMFERFYDIEISEMKFKIDGKMVVYNCKAVSVPVKEALGTKRGIVDNDATLLGATVDDALQGTADGNLGLFTKLNNIQTQLLKEEKIGIANKFKVVYLGEAENLIKPASIVSKADTDKLKWPMFNAKTTDGVTPKGEVSSAADNTKKEVKINKGTAILQAIQQIITSSSYLEQALSVVYAANEEPDPDSTGEDEIKTKKPREISWYNVSAEVKCLGYDTIVSDFAYETTYIIQPYSTPVVTSAYVKNTPRYYGPHKRYEYWFTGKNSEIISYSQTMDNTYFTVAIDPGAANAKSKGASQTVPVIPNKPQNQPKQGELNIGKEAQNSYMTSLFDPGAYAEAKIQILGDPDYLMCESSSSINEVYNQFYAADGFTINPNGGQVFIEINFKEPMDYQNSTGLQSINESILFYKYPASVEKDIKSRGGGVSYMIKTITHTFSKGKFVQDLECVINTFDGVKDEDAKTGAGRPVAGENQSAAETARLSRGSQTSSPTSDGGTTSGTGFVQAADPASSSDATPSNETPVTSTGTGQQTSPTGSSADGNRGVADDDASRSGTTSSAINEGGRE